MYKLYLGNCLDVIQTLPQVDLIVTSPPYGVGKDYEKGTPFWKTIWLVNNCIKECAKILKPGGYICWNFGDHGFGKQILKTETLTTIPMSIWYWQIGRKWELELQATRIWRKPNATIPKPFFLNYYPRPVFDYEHIWTWRKPDGIGKEKVRENKLGRRGVWPTSTQDEAFEGKFETHVLKNHSASFPVALPKWCLEVYSDEGDTVLDPFMGYGTTGIACLQMKRNFIGIELDKTNFESAKNRILDYQEPLRKWVQGELLEA